MKAPKSICLLNDSFPPLIDGVANTVVNYAQELTKLVIPFPRKRCGG